MALSRRDFVHAGCLAVSATFISGRTEAFWKGSATAGFNGGKSQVNFNFANGNVGEYPFLNLMKSSGTWQYGSGGPVLPTDLDANGYPTVIKNGGPIVVISIPPQSSRPGNYVLTADGNGTLSIAGNHTTVSGSLTSSGGAVRYVFSTTDSQLNIGISAVGSPYITNLKFYHIADEAAILAGEQFGTQFKARLAQGKFGVYRFGNWQNMNSANTTTWATRKPATYFTWAGQELRASLWAGSTTNSGDDYSLTFGIGAPADKTQVLLEFNASKTYPKTTVTFTSATNQVNWTAHGLSVNDPVGFGSNGGTLPTNVFDSLNFYVLSVVDANTITVSLTQGGSIFVLGSSGSGSLFGNRQPTLNLNGTGAIPIKGQYGATLGTSNSPQISMAGAAIYDATLGSWLLFGGGPGSGNIYLNCGVPPEVCFQLCVEMGAHPYFVLNYMSADPITDYMAGLAAYLQANAPYWMIPRFEGCDEIWNTNAFPTAYANNKALAYGWGANQYNNWMGKSMSLLGQAIAGVYGIGNLDKKYQVLCGLFNLAFSSLPVHSQDPRLNSALYVSTQGGIAAAAYVSHVCPNQYMVPSDYNTATETTLAAAWAGGDNTALATYVDTLNSGTGGQRLSQLAIYYANIKTWAAGFGVNKMCGYEGGYSPDYNGTNTTFRAATKLVFSSGQWATGLQGALKQNYDSFVSAGGEFPSCFQLGGPTPSSNAWSVLEDIWQSPDPPQWLAIVAFNA